MSQEATWEFELGNPPTYELPEEQSQVPNEEGQLSNEDNDGEEEERVTEKRTLKKNRKIK